MSRVYGYSAQDHACHMPPLLDSSHCASSAVRPVFEDGGLVSRQLSGLDVPAPRDSGGPKLLRAHGRWQCLAGPPGSIGSLMLPVRIISACPPLSCPRAGDVSHLLISLLSAVLDEARTSGSHKDGVVSSPGLARRHGFQNVLSARDGGATPLRLVVLTTAEEEASFACPMAPAITLRPRSPPSSLGPSCEPVISLGVMRGSDTA
ncbi:hypothetical protein ACCO45_003582 [Purpureocillium lilacinum]|uniref:Uncharacterized protein n=1 Tax=Purpureocillium lilacinum TaxID=33203 RepID=A0ACC4E0A4_PURLI